MTTLRRKSPVNVTKLMAESGGVLSQLLSATGELSRINHVLHACLPGSLAGHVSACAIHGDVLVLQTDSPAWSTRLRLEQDRLLAQLRAHKVLTNITRLKITVTAPAATSGKQPRNPKISAQAAEHLAQCADSQTDAALRSSLARLSRRT